MLREATELISTAERSFIINVGGTLDPVNIEIAIENTGHLPVTNPCITVNSRNKWHAIEGLATKATCRLSDRDEEKTWVGVPGEAGHRFRFRPSPFSNLSAGSPTGGRTPRI